jgi:aspartyl-tRNA(Asn)/glutamyl-tRNA(Gln) amidotransferase subunit C
MSLQPEDILGIAHLARLQIEPDEVPEYARELSSILALVEQMNAADTRNVEPMAHPLDEIQRLRADEVTEPDQHERFQAIAPQVRDDLYLVPRVID